MTRKLGCWRSHQTQKDDPAQKGDRKAVKGNNEGTRIDSHDNHDSKGQRLAGLFFVQLDDLPEYLKKEVQALSVIEQEWQLHPGLNTIGMLQAYVVIIEVNWIDVAVEETSHEPDVDEQNKRTVGIYMEASDSCPLLPELNLEGAFS